MLSIPASKGRVSGVSIVGMRGRRLKLGHVKLEDMLRHFPPMSRSMDPEKDKKNWLAWCEQVRTRVTRSIPRQYAFDGQRKRVFLYPSPINDFTLELQYGDVEEEMVDQGARA